MIQFSFFESRPRTPQTILAIMRSSSVWNDADGNPAGLRGNHALVRHVSFFSKFDSKKSQPIANPGADLGPALSHWTQAALSALLLDAMQSSRSFHDLTNDPAPSS